MTNPRPTPWLAIIALLVTLPVLYVLSIGPVAGLIDHGYLPQEPVASLYAPLEYFMEHGGAAGQACGQVLLWYVEFFVAEQPDFTVPTAPPNTPSAPPPSAPAPP
jgi:hypothetical protein